MFKTRIESLLRRAAPNCCIKRGLFGKRSTTAQFIKADQKFVAQTYDPLEVVISSGKGSTVWDVDGVEYLDFLGGYAALNTGHCHPKILACLQKQAATLTHTSRAFYNSELPIFAEYVNQYFGYDRVLPMNSGCEGAETAVKIARRWGYLSKGIPENEAIVVFAHGNFWGRSLAAISTSTKPIMYEHFGPFMPGFGLIPYDNVCALEEVVQNKNVCAFMMEPIQGENGVVVPSDRYLAQVRQICSASQVLWIADEIQTGLGRTGKLLAVDHECVRPDLLVLGKSLAGGFLPMSAVLGNEEVMGHMTCGTHGSTFGGNPLACRVAMTTLDVIREENLCKRAETLGEKFRSELKCRLPKATVPYIRGRGLMNAIEVCPDYLCASSLVQKFKECGLLTKSCNETTIRFTPPLVVTEKEICQALDIISNAVHQLTKT